MSKINQIQNKLLELSGGAFQKLADAYLKCKGYDQINSIGSVIGSDKVRQGTPDTLIPLPNGKYVFAEHTTKEKELYKKLKEDLDKCFDEDKTGIPVSKIEEVVFCYISKSKLNTSEWDSLREECQKRGVNLNIFNIDTISQYLYHNYPGIARDFLGVEVDTGQIVTRDEFVNAYNKNKLATRLDTNFHFRQEDLKQVLSGLENNNLVIITGKAGVGKTRFVLECCDRFIDSHSEYKFYCIRWRDIDIFEDIRVYFSDSDNYLIFVDDANRVNSFNYFIHLLQDQREDQNIKIIVTVRDYAYEKIKEKAESYGNSFDLELQPLEEKQIKQLVQDEYDINHHFYLERIADIAQGNPRLAIMAAEVAKKENTLTSINDVSSLYEQYFRSIRQDLEELGDKNLLKVAAIVAFFRIVDRSNEEMMSAIEQAFEISQENFWQVVCKLHELELLDLYENEVVKTSDQVLSTYLFYLAFFKEKVVEFSTLLEYFFPQFQFRFVESLNPILSAFDIDKIKTVMRPEVDQAWGKYKVTENETNLIKFIQVFWFLKQTDILLYVCDCIDQMEAESVNLSKLDINSKDNIPSLSLLNILSLFSRPDKDNLRIALELILKYLTKRPQEISQIFSILTKSFGFEPDSSIEGFIVQHTVVDVLLEKVNKVSEEENELFLKLFVAVAKHYLKTNFDTVKNNKINEIRLITFSLPATPQLIELRQKIWQNLFQLYEIYTYREQVVKLLYEYSKSDHKKNVFEILKEDAKEVFPFIESGLDSSSYYHCHVVQEYLDYLENHKIPFNKELRKRFTNEIYTVYKILTFDWADKKNYDLSWEEYQEYKKRQIETFFAAYNFADYCKFFEQCLEIYRIIPDLKCKELHFIENITDVLITLSHRDERLYIEVLQHYLKLENPFKINSFPLVNRLLQILRTEQTYEFLNQTDYSLKRRWLFYFHILLSQEEIKVEHLDELYNLFRQSESSEMPNSFDFLLKYRLIDDRIVVRVTEIVLEKMAKNSSYFSFWSFLFNPYTELNKNLISTFKDNLDLLQEAYLMALKAARIEPFPNNSYLDNNGQNFNKILNADPNFIIKYIEYNFNHKAPVYYFDDFDDIDKFSFLWRRDDYEELMTQLIKRFYRHPLLNSFLHICHYLKKFFILEENGKDNDILKQRQDDLLQKIIETSHQNINYILFLFEIIRYFSDERRYKFIQLFLKYNKKFEDFKKISLEYNSVAMIWTDSFVPMYQKRVNYLESLLPLLNTIEFLQHKQYIESEIQRLREEIEQEKKRDFTDFRRSPS